MFVTPHRGVFRMKKIPLLCIWIFYIFCVGTNVFGEESKNLPSQIIQNIPPNGIVINAPGTYVFANDITWAPTSAAVAITIQSNDVVLDMQGFTLESIPTLFKTRGILAEASENLQIIKGTVRHMGLFGIECNQCLNVSIKEIAIDGLNADDTVNFTQPAGILANACINVSIDKCIVKNIKSQVASLSGIQFNSTIGASVTNSQIKNLLNRDGVCAGIGHLLCQDILVKSCKIANIQTQFIDNNNTSGHTAIGILPFLSSNIKISKCDISNITGCCDDAHGLSLFVCSNAIVKKCKVRNVLDGAGPAQTGAKATGIEVYASEVTVIDCFVKNIVAINPQDLQAAGYSVALANDVKFIRCEAKKVKVVDAQGNYNPTLGFGVGFGWAPDPRPEFLAPATNILYLDCIAAHCQVGFDTWDHINSVWAYVVSKCNDIAILVQENGQRTISCNPCSECGCLGPGCYPTPYVVTIDNQAKNNIFEHVKTIKCSNRKGS